jgi:hypothetical protein
MFDFDTLHLWTNLFLAVAAASVVFSVAALRVAFRRPQPVAVTATALPTRRHEPTSEAPRHAA